MKLISKVLAISLLIPLLSSGPLAYAAIAEVSLAPVKRITANGQKTVSSAGTAEVLTASSTPCVAVIIKALAGNTNNVYVGKSTVDSTNGFVLDAGETLGLDVDNVQDIWIDTDTSSEGVSWLAIR